MLNIRRFQNGLQIVPSTGGASATTLQGELAVDNVSGSLYYNNGSSSSAVLTAAHSAILTNKTLVVNSTTFVDGTDTTKEMNLSLSGASTLTETTLNFVQTANRSITFPDASGFLVLSGSSGVITGNLLDESSVWFVDHTDTTKAFKFNVSGASTGTSMTLQSSQTSSQVLILPNASDTLVARNTTDTLTNKTLTSPILNTPTADTITGIAGGALVVQSASNQNLTLQSQGSGVVNISGTSVNVQNIAITNNTITGPSTADLTIATANNKNIQLSPNGSGTIVANSPMVNVEDVSYVRANDASTTGTAATLAGFVTSYVKVTNGSLVSLSGIPAGVNGQILVLTNGTGNSIVVNNEDGSVLAANRILTGTNSSINLSNNTSIDLIYDSDSARWRVTGSVGGPPMLFGSRGSPELITAGTGINVAASNMSASAIDQVIFVAGNGGPVTITASPAIQAGTIIGQRMQLIGRDNTNTVTLQNSNGQLELNGDCTLGLSDVLNLIYDGTAWVETSRS